MAWVRDITQDTAQKIIAIDGKTVRGVSIHNWQFPPPPRECLGCQYKIADYIVDEKADYVFSLKENQQSLYEDAAEYFKDTDFFHPASDALVETTFDA